MRGEKQKDRDRSIRKYPKEFQRYYHKEYKPKVNPGRDATPEELAEAYEDWNRTNQIVGAGIIIGIGTYEVIMWGVAIIAAPETLGGSLLTAGALP